MTGPASQRHRLALLALLAHSPHHVSARERLIGLLWPEAEASTARQLLSVTVYELRKALGDAVLLSEGPTLRLDPDQIDIDSLAFERTRAAGDAESATALYTGPFLDGFALPDALEFERWVESERDRIERAYQGALEQLAERAAAQGDRSQAVHWWRQRLACTPTEGRVVRRLMEALQRAGDRAGALQVADVHNATLLREFGADPDAEVTALADRLRRTVRVTPPLPANRLDGGAREPPAKPPAVFPTGQRIAVLPFTAIPSDLEGNALALVLTDELIAGLSQFDGLAIICRTTIMQYRGATRSVRQIGAELGVGIVVEGAVHANGERLHVNARLVDTASDQLLWSSSYDRARDEILGIDREIASDITGALAVDPARSSRLDQARPPAVDPQAYRDYLLGRYFFGGTAPDQLKAASYVERAIARDATFADAHAMLSNMQLLQGVWGMVHPSGAFARARAAAERALSLDPLNGEANCTLAGVLFWHDWNLPAAEHQFRIARQKGGSTFVDTYMPFCLVMDRPAEAIAEAERALALDPLSPFLTWHLATTYTMQGRYQDALIHWQNTFELRPDFAAAQVYAAATYALMGRQKEAVAGAARAEQRVGLDPMSEGMLGFSYALAGQFADARRILNKLRAASTRYLDPLSPAFVYAGLGDVDQTMHWLERAYVARSPCMILLGVNARTIFGRISSDPRYLALLERMKLKIPG